MTQRLVTLEQLRSRSRIDPACDCWIWAQGCTGTGSPNVWHAGKTRPAGRLAWILAYGDMPRSMRLVRSCGDIKCINPAHGRPLDGPAFAKYQHGNHGGRKSRVRSVSVRLGRINAGYTKLHDKVEAIRQRIYAGYSNCAIARDYGVHHSSISNIRRGRSWPEVSPWSI